MPKYTIDFEMIILEIDRGTLSKKKLSVPDDNRLNNFRPSYTIFSSIPRYEGALNDVAHAVVLLSWKEKQPMTPENMRCFLSTDTELSTEQILHYYGERWSIETFFKNMKSYFGFDGYQIRNKRALQRFWLLLQFAYLFVMNLKKTSFYEAIQDIRTSKKASIIEFVYHQTKQGVPLSQIKNELKVA